MTDATARLNLPYIVAGQLQKHVTLNEAMSRLDSLVQTAVASRTTVQSPEAAEGVLHILPAGATGPGWTGRAAGTLVRREGQGWVETPVADGALVYVLDEGLLLARRNGGWTPVGGGGGGDDDTAAPEELHDLTRLGLGAQADAVNPFVARVNKALWTARPADDGGDGDLRMTFNKDGAADVLSILMQSGFGGRAELGLIGDDDVTLKVSADGATWREVLRADRTTGRVRAPFGVGRAETSLLTVDQTYTPPAWARTLSVACCGGGGGGGSGAAGTNAGSRFGGGGGGGGGVVRATFAIEALTGALTIDVGAGGSGAAGATQSGAGSAGQPGGDTRLRMDGVVILSARGGAGGLAGGSSSGLGGAGGAPLGAAGGASSVTTAALPGETASSVEHPGAGGGGGGLNSSHVVRASGAGGKGAVLGREALGGVAGTGSGGAGAAGVGPAIGGGGGAGGASTWTVASGFAGGPGGLHGGGGGGGGAGPNASGAGGAGATGCVLILAQG